MERQSFENPGESEYFIQSWVSRLLQIQDLLKESGKVHPSVDISPQIQEWATHPDHGAMHGYNVACGCRYLADCEGINDDKALEILDLMSVLHDFAQGLPRVDYGTGLPNESLPDMRLNHHRHIAQLVLAFASELGLDVDIARQVALDLFRHDFTYQVSPDSQEYSRAERWYQGSPLGAILHDSDKLWGGGFSLDVGCLCEQAVSRNITEGLSPRGGYICRDDLSDEILRKWTYGDRWLQPWSVAVGSSMYRTRFLTRPAIELSERRTDAFLSQATIGYGALFDQMSRNVCILREAIAVGKNVEIYRVGADNPRSCIDSTDVDRIIHEGYERVLPLNISRVRDCYLSDQARGWMIVASIDGEEIIIDPSVAKFGSKEEFLAVMMRILTVFKLSCGNLE